MKLLFNIFPLDVSLFVYLKIKLRRWTNKINGEVIKRDWELVATGNNMMHEFTPFLKEIYR